VFFRALLIENITKCVWKELTDWFFSRFKDAVSAEEVPISSRRTWNNIHEWELSCRHSWCIYTCNPGRVWWDWVQTRKFSSQDNRKHDRTSEPGNTGTTVMLSYDTTKVVAYAHRFTRLRVVAEMKT